MNDWPAILGVPLWGWLFVLPSLLVLFALLRKQLVGRILAPAFRVLDRLYLLSGIIAALFLILILLLIVAQMIARWSGLHFEGSTEFAGYAMAATSFFALAHALTYGAHIRVAIFLNQNRITRYWLNGFAMYVSAITATYFARYAIKTNFTSQMLNDRTQGQDQLPDWLVSVVAMFGTAPGNWGTLWAGTESGWVFTPVWLPQIVMSIGATILAIALWDHLTRLFVHGKSSIQGESIQ
jgi:TRAP-type C4-dicarboxylate transport system permease small subunit